MLYSDGVHRWLHAFQANAVWFLAHHHESSFFGKTESPGTYPVKRQLHLAQYSNKEMAPQRVTGQRRKHTHSVSN